MCIYAYTLNVYRPMLKTQSSAKCYSDETNTRAATTGDTLHELNYLGQESMINS